MPRRAGHSKPPITVQRIVDEALAIVDEQGYAAVSMRTIAARLDTGPASLYSHIPNKFELDQRLVARLWARVTVPEPDPQQWRQQLVGVYLQQAELFRRNAGIENAYFGSAPDDPAFLEFVERAEALYEAGGFHGVLLRHLEATLEAMTISWAIQSRVRATLLDSLGITHEEWFDIATTSARADPERFPRVAASDYHSYATAEERLRAFEQRLYAVIAGFEAQLGAAPPADT